MELATHRARYRAIITHLHFQSLVDSVLADPSMPVALIGEHDTWLLPDMSYLARLTPNDVPWN